ncbi:hypothetical protein EYC80_001848 [Monilinia laxa]|uniref:Dynamin N-terminal domain-containing protein n=1 Tax=Monilinia laxa TaxID=61186 RepID=A0A5N6K6B3_MONLA|nr:hypothetical protein EYC80_001848 [Monilinia laxa]
MAELHGNELASHRALHEKALTVAPSCVKEPGEFWVAVFEHDKNVLDWDSGDLHWFKVKSKQTVAKIQKAYHKKCGVMALLHQGNHVVSLTSQMHQINHFKDDIILFWSTSTMPEGSISTTSRPPLQSVDTAIQNRMHPSSQKPPKIEPDSESTPVRMNAEANLSTASSSPFNTPAISRSLPQAVQFGKSTSLDSGSLETSSPTSEPINGYNMFAESHRENYLNTKTSPAAVERNLKKSWSILTPATLLLRPIQFFWFNSFAETNRANYANSTATPAEVESSLRRTWDTMAAGTREYYSKKAASNLDALAPNNDSLSPHSVVDTKSLQESSSPSANGHSTSVTGGNNMMGFGDDGSPVPKDEDETPEPGLPIARLTKTRLSEIIEDSSPEVLEKEAKKSYDFLTIQSTGFIKSAKTLQAQGIDTPTIIGVVGNTGAGKSSVINAMLDEERLVPTNCMRACTAVVTEMSWNSSDDPNKKYRAEIEFVKEDDWKKDLQVSLADLINDSGKVSSDCTNPEADAGVAYAKIKAGKYIPLYQQENCLKTLVYPNMTKEMIEDSSVEEMLAYGEVQTVLGTTKTVEKSKPESFYKELQQFVDSKEKSTGEKGKKADKEKQTIEFWPLIKVVRIFVKADALSTGAVIVDLPGVHDSNAARTAVAAGYMKQCTGLWVCAPINRAVDDKAAKSLLGESFKRQLKYDGQFSRITFICSKTDDISVLEASDSLGLEEVMAEDKSLAVYGSIFSDADETFDIWDDLKRDAEDGKTVYSPKVKEKSPKRKHSPSPKESRKKAKRSGYENDGDDFIYDGDDNDDGDQGEEEEVPDDEAEVEEENIDRSEPLTIEGIEQKLDELKDTKKKARKEKAAIKLAIKDVRKELRESDEARREIDTRMRAKCIDGRNKYSKGAIQQDFAAGIKELDNINAEEEDEDNFDPENEIRDYEAVAQSLPVFCISSRAYQQLNGRLQKDAKIPGFRQVDETEIPQLKAHCKKLTEAGRSANCRRFLNSLVQIVLSLSLWANDDGTGINLSDSQKITEAQWLQKMLKDLEEELDETVGCCMIDMEDVLNENIFEKFGEVISLAVEQAPGMASKWGAPINKFDRDAGGLYWGTYKETVDPIPIKMVGFKYNPSNDSILMNEGTHDWNSQLTEPIMKHLAGNWEKIFSRRLPSVLEGFTTTTNESLKTFHRDVESRSRKTGAGISGLAMLAQQIRTYETTFSILGTEMMDAINTLQREANREFVPVVARKLASAYTWCTDEVDHMHGHIDQSRRAMFTECCDEVKTKLMNMCEQIEESMDNKTDGVFALIRRDYLQVLNGAQVTRESMPKWEGHMRSDIAHALETHERDEVEKVATAVKDEEAKEDDVMNDTEFGRVDGDNDKSADGTAVQDNESNSVAENTTVVETCIVKRAQSGDDETDDSKKFEPLQAATEIEPSQMDVDGHGLMNETLSSTEDFSTDALFTEAASAGAPCSNAVSNGASENSSTPN